LDLFAGTGALGLEALSRGAATAAFVERDHAALASLRANLETLAYPTRPGSSRWTHWPPWNGVSGTVSDSTVSSWTRRISGRRGPVHRRACPGNDFAGECHACRAGLP